MRSSVVHGVAAIVVAGGTVVVMTLLTRDDAGPTTTPSTMAPISNETSAETGGRLLSRRDLAGWRHAGDGGFDVTVEAGRPVYVTRGGPGVLWYGRALGDFEVAFDFEVREERSTSGVFLRMPRPSEGAAAFKGVEVQISTRGIKFLTGGAMEETLVFFAPMPGRWHHARARVVGDQIILWMDGSVIHQFPTQADESFPGEGYLGLENHSSSDIVSFRDIRMLELSR